MHLISAESTDLFSGPPDAPRQLVRVAYARCSEPTPIRLEGDGLAGEAVAEPAAKGTVDVPAEVADPTPGQSRTARAVSADSAVAFTFTVAEPGWTICMVCHFHYDPVWWNTQAEFTQPSSRCPPRTARCRTSGLPSSSSGCTWRRPPRPGLQIRAGRGRLSQAVFRRAPGRPRQLRELIAQGRVGWKSSAAPTTSRTPT